MGRCLEGAGLSASRRQAAKFGLTPRAKRIGTSWRLGVLVFNGLALTGCAVGPTYHAPPTPPTASAGFISGGPASAAAQPLPPSWWRLYQDPILDRLVGEALTANTDLRVAAANLAYAQGLLDEARAGRFPTTTVTAGGTEGRSSLQALQAKPAGFAYSAGFTAAYQVDLFGRVRRTVEAARADAEGAAATADAVRVTVAARTAGAYADACGYGEQLAVARHSLDLTQNSFDHSMIRRNVGALSDFDIDRDRVTLEQAKAAIPPLEGAHRAALLSLAALTGGTPAEIPADAAACASPPRLTQALPVGDGASLLRRRPDIRAAERALAAATARIGVATADFYPTITLGGGVSNAAAQIAGLGNASTGSFNIGPLLTWSFPNILVARAHVKQAGAQTAAALARFDGVVLQALRETETALTTYDAELRHHAALTAARVSADEAQRLALIQFKAGTASILDLLTAQTAAVAADQAVAASDQAIADDQVAVFEALGGGWEREPIH